MVVAPPKFSVRILKRSGFCNESPTSPEIEFEPTFKPKLCLVVET